MQAAPWLQVLAVPGAGRGLFAAQAIEQGTVVLMERPMLSAPSPHALDSTCHGCLQPLPLSTGGIDSRSSTSSASTSATPFCSPGCAAEATGRWAEAAAACDLRPLQHACREGGDKFPLMLAQLACLQIQHDRNSVSSTCSTSTDGGGDASCSSSSGTGGAEAAASSSSSQPSRGDALSQLRHLCFAKVPALPPEPWVHMHSLLLQGLLPLCASSGGKGTVGSGTSGTVPAVPPPAVSESYLRERFSLPWFAAAMARLHINAFRCSRAGQDGSGRRWRMQSVSPVLPPCRRVDTVPALDPRDPAALLRAAAASLSPPVPGSDGGVHPHRTGSAAYLLASMLNHSCEPNLDVTFPANDAVLALVAARDIAPAEQLTISYVDGAQGLAARRSALEFGYGFRCRCQRCREEEAEAEGAGGPRQ